MFTVTVQVLEPVTATLRLYQLFPLGSGRQRRGTAATAATATAAGGGRGGGTTATAAGAAAVVDRDAGVAAAAAPGLGRQDLVVHRAQVHALAGPGVDEVGEGDGPAAARRGPDRQVLPEGRGALDGGLVDLLVLDDGVRAAVAGHRAHVLARVVGRADVVIDDVVLDQRVGRPAVERQQVGAAVGVEAAVVA